MDIDSLIVAAEAGQLDELEHAIAVSEFSRARALRPSHTVVRWDAARYSGLMRATENAEQTELRQFFEQYAKTSQAQDPGALAALYGDSFIVGGPQGSKCFANDMNFIEWLKQVYDSNQKSGMRSLEVVSVEPIALSPVHTLAIVKWGARFERTGDRLVEFQISYLLEHTTKGTKILSYISQVDEEAERRALGLR